VTAVGKFQSGDQVSVSLNVSRKLIASLAGALISKMDPNVGGPGSACRSLRFTYPDYG